MQSRRRRHLVPLAATAVAAVAAWLVVFRHPLPIRQPARPLPVKPVPTVRGSEVSPRPTAAELRAAARGANVVVVIMDAARADHFGAYGYQRETTPNFDRLARESILFYQHFCNYTQTSPSTATLFTGQYPDRHGVAVPRTGEDREPLRMLDPFAFTLDGAMKAAGLSTFLFTSTPAAAPVLNLGSHCDVLISPLGRVHSEAESKQWKSPAFLLDRIRERLDTGSRFYAYIHFLPPHEPYLQPEEFTKLFAGKRPPRYFEARPAYTRVYGRFRDHDPPVTGPEWVNLYDAHLRWSDWALGELVKFLKDKGVYEKTLLIVTADHGEALGEHRYQWHVTCPYDEAIHIPLLIKLPGKRPPAGRVGALTETVDILPTILDLLGLSAPSGALQGRSLVPLITGERTEVRSHIFCRTGGRYPCYVVRNHDWALLLYQGGKMRALYDLRHDPGQTKNVIAEQPQVSRSLAAAFTRFALQQPFRPLDFVDPRAPRVLSPASANQPLPEEVREQLRSLGYLE